MSALTAAARWRVIVGKIAAQGRSYPLIRRRRPATVGYLGIVRPFVRPFVNSFLRPDVPRNCFPINVPGMGRFQQFDLVGYS